MQSALGILNANNSHFNPYFFPGFFDFEKDEGYVGLILALPNLQNVNQVTMLR